MKKNFEIVAVEELDKRADIFKKDALESEQKKAKEEEESEYIVSIMKSQKPRKDSKPKGLSQNSLNDMRFTFIEVFFKHRVRVLKELFNLLKKNGYHEKPVINMVKDLLNILKSPEKDVWC
jgi:hypothetical protein